MKVAQKILVPLDFSEASLAALDYAVALRAGPKVAIDLVHVIDPILFLVTAEPYGAPLDTSLYLKEQRDFARQRLGELSQKLTSRGIPSRPLLVTGSPQPSIADAAKKLKSDLIVMSTHGRSGLSHLLLGSVAEKVVRTAPCPVLLVRGAPAKAKRKPAKRRK